MKNTPLLAVLGIAVIAYLGVPKYKEYRLNNSINEAKSAFAEIITVEQAYLNIFNFMKKGLEEGGKDEFYYEPWHRSFSRDTIEGWIQKTEKHIKRYQEGIGHLDNRKELSYWLEEARVEKIRLPTQIKAREIVKEDLEQLLKHK